jgi:cystathionine gamma-lyase
MDRGDGTRVIRAGLPAAEQGEPFLPGPVLAAPYHLSGDPAGAEFTYGRYGNPTWSAYERALGELEGGDAVLFASGMAAVAAVLSCLVARGDAIVMPSDCYMHVRGLAGRQAAVCGLELQFVPTARLDPGALPDELRLLWLESPSNPRLDVCDIAQLAAAAHDRGAIVAVDNTLATPLGQRSLELGADLSITSATKHLSGHADLLLGYVAVRSVEHAEALRGWRKEAGSIPAPFETWLAHRSLATLELRLERGCANALALARLLAGREDVERVRYPGLPDDPAHAVAARQMRRFGTVVSFDLGSRGRAERFLGAAELVTESTSFGGVHTTAERRARWAPQGDTAAGAAPLGDDVPEGFVRLSAGCEDGDDLVADVRAALDA